VEPTERVDGKISEAYQVSNRHFDALLELTNGDMEDGYITSKELETLQVAGYCNVVIHYETYQPTRRVLPKKKNIRMYSTFQKLMK
jgi:hypothetical protein